MMGILTGKWITVYSDKIIFKYVFSGTCSKMTSLVYALSHVNITTYHILKSLQNVGQARKL